LLRILGDYTVHAATIVPTTKETESPRSRKSINETSKSLLDFCRRNINSFTTKALGFSVIGIRYSVERDSTQNRRGCAGSGTRKQFLNNG